MSDTVDRQTRSRIMRAVPRLHTHPELLVRRGLHRLGFRFRVADRRLPGSPDLKLTRYRAVVFVNGCFWHRHDGCRYATMPATNRGWWQGKFAANVLRDAKKVRQLLDAGWRVMVVWECALRQGGSRRDDVIDQLAAWIRGDDATGAIPRRLPSRAPAIGSGASRP